MSLPWQFVGYVPQGPKGDRLLITAQREVPNSFVTLYGQLQVWDVGLGDYVNEGVAEALTEVYDGWVHVGFWLPSVTDNGDGTATFWRQWYCRESAESNVFNAEGAPENMGTVNLPEGPRGPVGGHYLITSTNPQSNVAYFFRRYAEWNEQTLQWDYSETIEQFGGIEAPPGPQGETGDFYELLAENPIGQNDTVVLYRQRRDGMTEAIVGQPEQIGSAVAVQGPVGPQGPQGPAGGVAGFSVNLGWQEVSEWQRLGFLAEKFVGWVSETIVNNAEFRTWAGDAVSLFGATATTAIAGTMIGGPPGAAVGGILGFGIATMDLIADYAMAIDTLAYKQEGARLQMAQDLYCDLIPYRDLSHASVDAWVSLWENQSQIINPTVDASHNLRIFLAKHWREVGITRAREEMAEYFLAYWYNPAFDYSSLPCTPDLGGGQTVYDFEIDAQGWAVRAPFPEGEYIAGTGWRGQPNDFHPNNRTAHIWINFAQLKTITHVEVLATDVDFIDGNDTSSFRLYIGDWQQIAGGAAHKPEGALVNWIPTINDPFSTEWLGISMVLAPLTPISYIKRVSITFAE